MSSRPVAPRRRLLQAGAWLALAPSLPTLSSAAPVWPSKPLRLVVAYPPGGTSDVAARLLGERLQARSGQTVVVENRAGASGAIGMDVVAKAAPDGHTLCFAAISPLTLSPHLGKVPYDPIKDIAPVAQVMLAPVYLLATSAFEGRTLAEALAQAKASPGRVRWATSGMGSVGHVMLEQLARKAGVNFTHIPYKGGGQLINDGIGGQFELFSTNPSPAVNAQIAQGRLRVLAVAAPGRLAALADAPTFNELGYPEASLASVFGLFAPGRTPSDVLRAANAEINAVFAAADVQARMTQLDTLVASDTHEAFAALVRREHEATGRIIRQAGIRAE